MGFLDAPNRATEAVTAQVKAQVPPLVSQAIASDPSVAQSAATMAQSTAGLVPLWKTGTAYSAGQKVAAPNGDIVSSKADHTSGTSYTAANWNASGQDGRLGALEAKQPAKAVRLENGKWIWDLANATHYLFPEPDGTLAVHATPWPVPNPTIPALDW